MGDYRNKDYRESIVIISLATNSMDPKRSISTTLQKNNALNMKHVF
jgi:hypothetical protein